MSDKRGIFKPDLQSLPQIKTRITFLYLEHCKLNRENNSITIRDTEGIIYLPAASISSLLLGPGTSVTHQAIELIGDAGISILWVGEHGVRFYAAGRPLTHSSELLMRQASLVSNTRTHLQVARKMYQMRFPDEDVSCLTMQQLRGREGSRIRKLYKSMAEEWNVEWNGRNYNPDDFMSGDDVNKALSSGNACLYGVTHAVIAALGCSPGLGFVHVGHERSFVYDIADLYKAEITIPIAFKIASENHVDIGTETRRQVRDAMKRNRLLERIVMDIHYLLGEGNEENPYSTNTVKLWNGTQDLVNNGINYADEWEGNEVDQ